MSLYEQLFESIVLSRNFQVQVFKALFLCIWKAYFYRVRLRADDREIASGTLADQATIGSPSSQIFIGGFPPAVKPPSNEMPVDDPLIGCVSDIYSEYRLASYSYW